MNNQTRKTLSQKLRYRLPSIKLCLVQEGKTTKELYPVKSPEDAEELLDPLKFSPDEQFVSLHLNAQNQVIGVHEVSHGTISASLVHPREVFKAALLANSHALVVCHNHPSGAEVTPSSEDLSTTRQLLKAGRVLGVNVLDHLILSPNHGVYSIRENYPDLWAH